MARIQARARTVDMLGRQQIAGIPTAISELFKNAHDAYADHVEIDFYRQDSLFVLRDDGFGMTAEEFESRWLTLGTDSKLRITEMNRTNPRGNSRPILGEKGIGRLAIAIIGPQVLVLTRALRDGSAGNLVMSFINWRLFECPGVDLSQIEIPVREFPGKTLPSQAQTRELVEQYRENLLKLEKYLEKKMLNGIHKDLDEFDVDPMEIDSYLGNPTLSGNQPGTQFFIKPASELLIRDIEGDVLDDRAPPLLRSLRGFTNSMTPDHEKPVINAAFRDHVTDEDATDLINESYFFRPEEFLNADHHIQGSFDRYGQFKGKVSVYAEEYQDHVVVWTKGTGRPTRCGPFKIHVAVVQGEQSATTLPLEEWTRLITKMNYYGGLYIYKDGIRVLPYGNTDFDWLDMERNRTKSASYYFFSYRRIFGVVEIGSKYNFELEEKAGREGFREEFAFRQFTGILKNFFIQLAADFFRDKGEYSESFQARRLELDRLHKARQKREKFVSVRRVKFREEMDAFFEDYDAGKPHEFALELNENIGRELDVASKITDEKLAAGEFLRIERSARARLGDLEAMYRVSKPRGIGFGRALLRDWAKYSDAYESLEKNVFGPANELVEDVVAEKARSARVELDRRLRIQNVLDELANVARRSAQGESGETSKALEKVDQEIKQASRESIEGLGSALKDVFSDFGRTDVDKLSDRQTVAARNRFELRIIAKQTEETEFLHYLRVQLEAISTDREQTKLDELEALEERTLVLEERADQDLQLTQLGMAIEVINHEFEASTKVVRDNLRRLKAWADLNSDLQQLYGNIKTSFDHLDAYLSLFTPLHRRLYRKEVQFSGAEIHKFLNDLFGERLKRHSIELKATQPFLGKRIVGFPSSFYPVFVNLLDNSIYWLRDQSEPRQIRLHTIDDAFAVSDNGPGIPERDQDDVFEFGFTRKPGGRGMGLHISREVLSRVGYEIVLVTKTQRGDSVTFLILPSKSQRGS